MTNKIHNLNEKANIMEISWIFEICFIIISFGNKNKIVILKFIIYLNINYLECE